MLCRLAIILSFVATCGTGNASTVLDDPAFSDPLSVSRLLRVSGAPQPEYSGETLTGYVLTISRLLPPVTLAAVSGAPSETAAAEFTPRPPTGFAQPRKATQRKTGQQRIGSGGGVGGASVVDLPKETESGPTEVLAVLPVGPQILNFDDLPQRINPTSVLRDEPMTITNTSGGKIFVYHSFDYGLPVGGGFCALALGDFNCTSDISIDFDVPISKLTFAGFFAGSKDAVFVSIFDGDENVFDGFFQGNDIDGLINFDFSWLSRITRILLDDRSDLSSKGIAYGDFKFEYYKVEPAPVPLPATGSVLLFGLAMLVLLHCGAFGRPRRSFLRMVEALPIRA